jgi:hypothetical protein
MDDLIPVILLIVAISIMIIGDSSYRNKAEGLVKNELEGKGCREIEMTRTLEFGRRGLTYD